jgi:hypothetical protein
MGYEGMGKDGWLFKNMRMMQGFLETTKMAIS